MKQKFYTVKLKVLYENGREAVVKIATQRTVQGEAIESASKMVAAWQGVLNIECLEIFQANKFHRPHKKHGTAKPLFN